MGKTGTNPGKTEAKQGQKWGKKGKNGIVGEIWGWLWGRDGSYGALEGNLELLWGTWGGVG